MGKRKILLVDDVSLLLEIEKSFLRNSPVHIFIARNGEEALEVVRQELPDLIFMDLNMPKMNGVSCCAALKADERWRSIPVVMVTTAGRDEDIQMCRQAGCDDFITKPIDRRIFLEKGRKFLPDIDRRETRVPFGVKVSIRGKDDVVLTGEIANISVGGFFVVSEGTFSNDANVVLTFPLSTNADEQIEVHGRVAWQNSKAVRVKPILPVGFGVEFIDPPDKTIEMIQAVVDSFKTPR